jgi:NAD(P)-dependent dehydrogenase (short-subunit alcohol dehydrogenase family)
MAARPSRPLALVTGAGSGIGKAIAIRLVTEGYRVAAVDRSRRALGYLKRSRKGEHLSVYAFDLEAVSNIRSLTRQVRSEFGDPSVLVNNAGVCLYADVDKITDEMWERSLNVNLLAAAALARDFVPAMKRAKHGSIVNVCSRNALSSSPRASTYDASKAALLAMTRTLAVELGPFGIRANAVLPGFIDTPVHGDLLQDKVFLKNYLKLIPLNRMGKSEDMANIVYFLASEQSAFVTGQGIVADGGQMSGQNYARVFGNLKSFKSRQRKT